MVFLNSARILFCFYVAKYVKFESWYKSLSHTPFTKKFIIRTHIVSFVSFSFWSMINWLKICLFNLFTSTETNIHKLYFVKKLCISFGFSILQAEVYTKYSIILVISTILSSLTLLYVTCLLILNYYLLIFNKK